MATEFSPAITEFLKEPNFLTLSTIGKDGTPQVSPVWFIYENGRFLVNAMNGRAKVANMKRDPRVAFIIHDLKNPYRYVGVRGRVVGSEGGETGHNDIDRLSERYTGNPRYQGDPDRSTDRITFYIEPESHTAMGF